MESTKMGISFRSYLDSKNVEFLNHKLERGEITATECKKLLKRLMLKGYEQGKAKLSDVPREYPELHVVGEKFMGENFKDFIASRMPKPTVTA